MYQIILFSIFVVVFVGFNILNYAKFGLLPSISDSHKHWAKENKNWMFLAATWGYALPALMLATTGLMFFGAAALFFVGIASDYEDRPDNKMNRAVHIYGAQACVVLAMLSQMFDYHMYWLTLITVMAMLILSMLKVKNATLWIEIAAGLSLGYTLFYNEVLPVL